MGTGLQAQLPVCSMCLRKAAFSRPFNGAACQIVSMLLGVETPCPVATPHEKGFNARNFMQGDPNITLPLATASEQVLENGITAACHMQSVSSLLPFNLAFTQPLIDPLKNEINQTSS